MDMTAGAARDLGLIITEIEFTCCLYNIEDLCGFSFLGRQLES